MESKNTDTVEEKTLTIIFIVSFLFIILLIISNYLITNSENYITRKYSEFHNYDFDGEIFKKTEDQKGGGANIARYVHLKTGIIHRVGVDKFYKLNIGDYIYKKSKSDTVYYILKHKKDTLKFMENNYLKEYLKYKK